MMLVWRISVLNQLHVYCTDIVRRNSVLVIHGNLRAKCFVGLASFKVLCV